jgi:hypothetical protein
MLAQARRLTVGRYSGFHLFMFVIHRFSGHGLRRRSFMRDDRACLDWRGASAAILGAHNILLALPQGARIIRVAGDIPVLMNGEMERKE